MVGRRAVNWDVRAGGIVRDHSADGGAGTRRHVWAETKSVRLEKRVQLIKHYTGADPHGAIFDVELDDLAIVPRKIDDQSFANRVAHQAGAGAARDNRNACVGRYTNNGGGLLCAFWKGRARGFNLINRRIGRVKLTGQIIKSDLASCL